jgi:hypothetical protein
VKPTSSINKTGVVFSCEKWVREFAEELLQESSNTVHIVHEVFGVAEVNFRSVYCLLAWNRNESFL